MCPPPGPESVEGFEFAKFPSLVKPWLEWAEEPEERKPGLPGIVWTQSGSLPGGAWGPKYRSTEPSVLAAAFPVLLATAGWMVEGTWIRERVWVS